MNETPARLAAALADRYRVERELGAGGMATVYLAHDLRHDRKVALKVLRSDLAAVIGAERFLQEIRTTANLQHPHILPLHDSGQVDGTVFYVMPFVEGESLRDRLTRDKQLPLDEALRFAREVADALGYAHERGIIHRDIKPENILLQRGHALVADFGIALAASRTGGSRMTETGLSLGTPHYMSPEQAMGERELGPRSDVYALGCVCYEMLCGEPPFTGPTPQAIVARVMTEAPRSLRSQRQTIPENVEAAILQALEKLPADRFGSATEFAATLGQPGFTRTTVAAPRVVPVARPGIWKGLALGFATLAALLLVVLATAGPSSESSPVPAPVMRFEVQVPDSIGVIQLALLADGSGLLVHSTSRAYLYRFGDMSWIPVPIPELKQFASSSLSPDGRTVAFVDDARVLKVAALSGGSLRSLAESARSVRWETDGYLYVAQRSGGRDRLVRVRPEGGPLEELVALTDSLRRLATGVLLPGGRLTYTEAATPDAWQDASVLAVDLASKQVDTIRLAPGSHLFGYAPSGHLLVYGRQDVHAIGFDPATLEVRGAPVQLVSPIPLGASYNAGILAYTRTPPGGPALFDRSGRRRDLPEAIATNSWGFGARVSPTGQAIAFWRYQAPADRWDIFTYRLPAGPLRRLTSDSAGENGAPSWSPDGRMVRYTAGRSGDRAAYQVPEDASAAPVPLLTRPGGLEVLDALPDGRVLAQVPGNALVLLRPGSDSSLLVVAGAGDPRAARVSRDGRWLAYSALELGRREVFVRPLDGSASRWQISRNGGDTPAWGRSGRELFFFFNDSIRVATLTTAAGFQAGEPRALFRVQYLPDFSGFDVLPGDSLFVLYADRSGERERILVVANFLAELQALNGASLREAP